jgi:hypothetical protein
MATLKKYLAAPLCTVFAVSLVLQVCCHQDWSELLAHEHQNEASAAPSHSHDHDKKSFDEDCGPHQFKDLFKSDKVSVTNSPPVHSFAISFDEHSDEAITNVLKNVSFLLVFFNKAGPPIYLLNSVFLN